jgi:hypothetical protein
MEVTRMMYSLLFLCTLAAAQSTICMERFYAGSYKMAQPVLSGNIEIKNTYALFGYTKGYKGFPAVCYSLPLALLVNLQFFSA